MRSIIFSCFLLVLIGCGGGSNNASPTVPPSTTPPASAAITTMKIYYLHSTERYAGWGLHLWGDAIAAQTATTWTNPRLPTRIENDYAYWEVPIINEDAIFSFIVHFGDSKSPNYDLILTPSDFGDTVWVVEDRVAAVGAGSTATPFADETSARAALADVITSKGNAAQNLDLSAVSVDPVLSELSNDWLTSPNFMEIYVRAYQDSDGDGIGDFNGLISRLDYLQDLGINGLWLMPIMQSSDNDHGYETQDYRTVEDQYGTLADFQNLLRAAHARGIAVVIDYVINHASYQNPLFLDASASADNPYRDWFIWRDDQPNWNLWGANPWRTTPAGTFYGAFTERMPDFNLTNPAVIEFHQNNMRYWLNMGVNGFRFDAVGVLVENGANQLEAQPENLTVMRQLQDVIDQYENAYIVCEAPQQYIQMAQSSACGRAFHFTLGHAILDSVKNGRISNTVVTELQRSDIDRMPLILANHDYFAGDRIYNQLAGNLSQYKLAAAIYTLVSANPFTYYGEEIGMAAGNNMQTDASLRTPMSWTGDALHAGFSTVTPFRTLAANVTSYNAALQVGVSDSLHHWYQQLYQLRASYPLLSSGTLTVLSNANESQLVFTRSDETNTLTVDIDLSNLSVTVDLNGQNVASMMVN